MQKSVAPSDHRSAETPLRRRGFCREERGCTQGFARKAHPILTSLRSENISGAMNAGVESAGGRRSLLVGEGRRWPDPQPRTDVAEESGRAPGAGWEKGRQPKVRQLCNARE